MSLWQSIKKVFGGPPAVTKPPVNQEWEVDSEDLITAEMTSVQMQQALSSDAPPLLLDVREQYEWDQVHIPAALHIPMNQVPDRLAELPRNRAIVVLCAHGSRSFGVTHFLREQGYDASNLAGGITQWRIQGGATKAGR